MEETVNRSDRPEEAPVEARDLDDLIFREEPWWISDR